MNASASGPLKNIGQNRIGSYGVLWGAPNQRDLAEEYFTPQTRHLDNIFKLLGRLPVFYHHALDPRLQANIIGLVDVIQPDETGLWVEAQLDVAARYRADVQRLIEAGALAWSSGCLPMGKQKASDGRLLAWPIIEFSLTPTPAEHRLAPVAIVKSALTALGISIFDLFTLLNTPGASTMSTLAEQLAQALASAKTALEQGDLDEASQHRQQAESIKALLDESARIEAMIQPPPAPMRPPIPGPGSGSILPAPIPAAVANTDATKAFHAVYTMRFGDEEETIKAVMGDLVGANYRQRLWDQYTAFTAYLRGGESSLGKDQQSLLRQQVFASSQIKTMLRDGYDVNTIKTTMIEAQGTLGGFAVPPTVQEDIISRLPGLTAIRGGGARVIDLVNGNAVEAPIYTGGNTRYRGALRGVWGNGEAISPAEKNATLGMHTIVAGLYTYKVPLSQTLVEDAANLVQLVVADIVDTASIDEDEAFLVGNGIGKPTGLLPDAANANALAEINSGNASTLTAAGIKALKRGIASQYRRNASFIGASDTFGDIEQLTVTGGANDWAFPDLAQTNLLLGSPVRESEAMPAVTGNAFPLLYGDLSGYWIVQKAGFTIVRFQDSNTGINKVEYHVRRRIGGYPAEPWKFAVQKISV